MAWFTRIDVHTGFVSGLLGPSLLVAVGPGLAFVPLTIASTTGVSAHEAGLAGGLINTSQQIGGATGLAVLATASTTRTSHLLATGHETMKAALTGGFQAAFWTGTGLLLAAALAAVLLLRRIQTPDAAADADRSQERVSIVA